MTTTMAHRLLKGTLLLTITGFITRVLGFFYRIYLADLLGAHYLGIYQLIFPVYAICFTIYGAGIQTALSQVIASRKNDRENPSVCLRYSCSFFSRAMQSGLPYILSWRCL